MVDIYSPGVRVRLESKEALSLVFFCVLGAVDIGIVALLNAAIERILGQEENVRILLDMIEARTVVEPAVEGRRKGHGSKLTCWVRPSNSVSRQN